jgi:ribosomal protein S27AE
MQAVMMECPRCGDEIEVPMDYQSPEYDTNFPGGYILSERDPPIRYCNCPLTIAELDTICGAAVVKANEPDYFGGRRTFCGVG